MAHQGGRLVCGFLSFPSVLLALGSLLLSACSTVEPTVVHPPQYVQTKIPAKLVIIPVSAGVSGIENMGAFGVLSGGSTVTGGSFVSTKATDLCLSHLTSAGNFDEVLAIPSEQVPQPASVDNMRKVANEHGAQLLFYAKVHTTWSYHFNSWVGTFFIPIVNLVTMFTAPSVTDERVALIEGSVYEVSTGKLLWNGKQESTAVNNRKWLDAWSFNANDPALQIALQNALNELLPKMVRTLSAYKAKAS